MKSPTKILPVRISPCPIREAIIEIRFETDILPSELFEVVVKALDNLGYSNSIELPISLIPNEIRSQINDFRYQPYHKVYGNGFLYQIGPQMLSISTVGDYPGWSNFKFEVQRVFTIINKLNIIKNITRLGLRYISVFDWNILPELNVNIQLGGTDLQYLPTTISTHLQIEDSNATLRVNNTFFNVQTSKPATLVDIDVEHTKELESFFDTYFSLLDTMHSVEKTIFFELLSDEFIETLHPEYEG